jgi:hypothetical protein
MGTAATMPGRNENGVETFLVSSRKKRNWNQNFVKQKKFQKKKQNIVSRLPSTAEFPFYDCFAWSILHTNM